MQIKPRSRGLAGAGIYLAATQNRKISRASLFYRLLANLQRLEQNSYPVGENSCPGTEGGTVQLFSS